MLPTTVFEHLTRAHRLKSETSSDERRIGQRIPVRGMGSVHRIDGGKPGPAVQVRIKDISSTGVAMLTSGKLTLSGEFVMWLPTPDGATGYWLWCALRRRAEFDRTCILTSATFLRLLLPGQRVSVGVDLNSLAWMDVEGDTVPQDREWKTAG